ncbi:MAG: pyruvate, phosphate dikinase, partial [Armatimonadetes bacterium]|nr:pyruvate, phosphate dikinase [Armatimonadota bacterium]
MKEILVSSNLKKETAEKNIYLFSEGNAKMRDLLGGKGANLAEMTNLGFPVPPGFIITTKVCNEYSKNKVLSENLKEEIKEKIKILEEQTGKKFGDLDNPLLVSVRSGAKFSMPGMMDTILNLGLNCETVVSLKRLSKDEDFAFDAYRRFLQMFSDVVLGIEKKKFEKLLNKKREVLKVKDDSEICPCAFKKLVQDYLFLVKEETKKEFPQDVYTQLYMAIEAVFKSWDNPRAVVYRNKEGIPHDLGTAVNIQAMVFGNLGENSGTGVAFTRDASTGKKEITGDFLFQAQGEDVVAGTRTPLSIKVMREKLPEIYQKLEEIAKKLETHYRDLQDLEFTIERGKLYMLQTRSAKRTAQASVKIAIDMVKEGLISKEEALMRVTPDKIDQLLHPYFETTELEKAVSDKRLLAKGAPASPGAACGEVVFESERALKLARLGKKIILVRPETTPDDAQGMLVSCGILTSTGGATSHAALVARGWGIPCVVGCEALSVSAEKKHFSVKGQVFKEGEKISIDGSTGEVFLGELPLISPSELTPDCVELLKYADEIKVLGVYANADNPKDAARARVFGATGIGLCRTEHMFMESDRLPVVQEMILSAPLAVRLKAQAERLETEIEKAQESKKKILEKELEKLKEILREPWERYQGALDKLLPIQKEDFKGILKVMQGFWVIIRLLDPPLHEFLPNYEELLVEVTTLKLKRKKDKKELIQKEKLLENIRDLREFNPMLGLRVCRLGI